MIQSFERVHHSRLSYIKSRRRGLGIETLCVQGNGNERMCVPLVLNVKRKILSQRVFQSVVEILQTDIQSRMRIPKPLDRNDFLNQGKAWLGLHKLHSTLSGVTSVIESFMRTAFSEIHNTLLSNKRLVLEGMLFSFNRKILRIVYCSLVRIHDGSIVK